MTNDVDNPSLSSFFPTLDWGMDFIGAKYKLNESAAVYRTATGYCVVV